MAKPPLRDHAPAPDAEHIELGGSPSEHIYMGSEETINPATAARTIVEKISITNAVRRTRTELTLFAEGFAKVRLFRSGRKVDGFSLDLRYLDPVPTISHAIAKRSLYVALGAGAFGGLAWLLAQLPMLHPFALPAALAAGGVAVVATGVALYRSYEKIEFATIHGRASVLSFVANLGSVRRFRAIVPVLSRAIEEAAEQIGTDTSAYLRAEMREHYRLRGEGVLTQASCADSTGRILAQFDIRL